MNLSIILSLVLLAALFAYSFGRKRSLSLASAVGGSRYLNSLPFYYGMLTALWSAVPALTLVFLWHIFDGSIIEKVVVREMPAAFHQMPEAEQNLTLNRVYNVAQNGSLNPENEQDFVLSAAQRVNQLQALSNWLQFSVIFLIASIGGLFAWLRIDPHMRARSKVEAVFRASLLGCASLAILTTIGIVMSVLVESLRFFASVPVTEFIFGMEWSPQNAIHKDQASGESSFGIIPLFAGTLLIAFIAMLVAVPTGLMSAIFLAEYAPKNVRSTVKPLLEILAGIPTVVYGFFAALTVAPFIRDFAYKIGLNEYMTVTSESALAAGLVMGVMIIPFISSLADDVITAVPQSLRDGALGLGATESEMIRNVVIPAALPGIVGGVLLAVSRAIGETMIVVMAAGLAANLTANPLDSVTTVTVQIVTLLVGDQEFDSPKTLAAFALGLVLFVVTLALNYVALHVVRKYREQYD